MKRRPKITNIRGNAWFPDANIVGRYQSQLERRGVVHVLLDPNTESAQLQAPRIHYLDASGVRRRYTGDCLVYFVADVMRRPLVIEYKLASELEERPELSEKFLRVEEQLNADGYEFVLHTESNVVTSEFPVKEFIAGYFNEAASGWEDRFCEVLGQQEQLTVAALLAKCVPDPVQQLHVLPSLWRYVARRKAFINFGQMPNLHTMLYAHPLEKSAHL